MLLCLLATPVSLAAVRHGRINGDLKHRPQASSTALAACGVGGAAVGACIGGGTGVLLGSALMWTVASVTDTIAAADDGPIFALRQRRGQALRKRREETASLHVHQALDAARCAVSSQRKFVEVAAAEVARAQAAAVGAMAEGDESAHLKREEWDRRVAVHAAAEAELVEATVRLVDAVRLVELLATATNESQFGI